MSLISLKKKNLTYRKNFKKVEKKKLILKFLNSYLLNNCKNFSKKKIKFFLYRKILVFNLISKSKIVNRCIYTNRSRGVFRPYGVSRFILRNLMQFGVLPGSYKSVW